ncbi:ERV/ALR sulfhydryl oxidase domain-containing protein [Kickxella alabastrina]|uniref:ERV/ALR sulfhydryl oxidase domain-containing protein n=1 Tax=Kickxella alabastrina TaxID=61397 RepID=UPI00221FA1E3|nr:ERV/ALR sulfhydryl oxidase domain-containing protein [Kickxella alabastrina]KAI7826309.1 ERV/ALR sulfhydryl oxidase domain-containing protein [Kickxella alabastrina]KAJ1943008.1 hypothetical protein GGF37_002850 [Kickxella alabastrina]
MLKIRSFLTLLVFASLGLLTYTTYQYRDNFRDRSVTNFTNDPSPEEDSGMFHNLLANNLSNLWQGDTHVVMGKMANETLRAQLGRRTWYLMHVMASRYPTDPTADERGAMKSFLFLLSRLYPCGDCAHHFQQHLKKHPPVVDSRDKLEQYLCTMHNVVNKSLKKPVFDCAVVHETYDCGCGPDNVRYNPKAVN